MAVTSAGESADTAAEGDMKNTDLPALPSGFLSATHKAGGTEKDATRFLEKCTGRLDRCTTLHNSDDGDFLLLVAALPSEGTVLWGGFVSWLEHGAVWVQVNASPTLPGRAGT